LIEKENDSVVLRITDPQKNVWRFSEDFAYPNEWVKFETYFREKLNPRENIAYKFPDSKSAINSNTYEMVSKGN
jgi:hypothetical protein